MTRREQIIKLCDKLGVDCEVLTREEILDNYVGYIGIDTVEDWCGRNIRDDEVVYWICSGESLFEVTKKDEELSDEQVNEILLFIDADDEDYEEMLGEK